MSSLSGAWSSWCVKRPMPTSRRVDLCPSRGGRRSRLRGPSKLSLAESGSALSAQTRRRCPQEPY